MSCEMRSNVCPQHEENVWDGGAGDRGKRDHTTPVSQLRNDPKGGKKASQLGPKGRQRPGYKCRKLADAVTPATGDRRIVRRRVGARRPPVLRPQLARRCAPTTRLGRAGGTAP